MTQDTRLSRLVLLFICVIVIGMAALLARRAHAQPPNEDTVRGLVITAWAEGRLTQPIEHAAFWHVLAKRAQAQGRTLAELTKRYVSIFKVAVIGKPRTRWLRAINEGCLQPAGWPTRMRWPHQTCVDMFSHAEAFMRGEVPDPFAGHACNWGAPYGIDHERAERFGWTQVLGPKTSNEFWACSVAGR